ncbi:hypothetical protein niasHT_006474 [Heterodera trifolii]|uniref:Heat shock protein 70 n=1 Tax=Heterodera trifolii TaxID=157864 RepID=A0ABD2LSG5_9BILA
MRIFFEVYEGENRLTRHNNLLGIVLLDIQPAPRGVPMIEVTFDMDENGTLNVMAQEKSAGGQKQKMNITNGTDDHHLLMKLRFWHGFSGNCNYGEEFHTKIRTLLK